MPQFLEMLYPSFRDSAYQESFVLLSRILLLQPILLGLSGVLASVTQVHRRFVLFALSPVLYNVGIIFGTLVLYPLWGLPGIGVGVIIGAVAYLAVNIPVVIAAGVFPRFTMPTFALMKGVVRDSVPRSLALGMGSVTALILTVLAARLGHGAVSVFTLASNLEAVPLGLISCTRSPLPALSAKSGET
jgi:putative peptidoglycan lipid II flippase